MIPRRSGRHASRSLRLLATYPLRRHVLGKQVLYVMPDTPQHDVGVLLGGVQLPRLLVAQDALIAIGALSRSRATGEQEGAGRYAKNCSLAALRSFIKPPVCLPASASL